MNHLFEFCTTSRQKEKLQAYINNDENGAKAARQLGINPSGMYDFLRVIRTRAARAGIAPECGMDKRAPEGYEIKGHSTLYGADGEVKLQWVKTNKALEEMTEAMRVASQVFLEDLPREEPRASTSSGSANLVNQYTLTDYHLGMMAWHEETKNDDWDLDISEDMVLRWFANAINMAPDAKTAIFCQLGDFMHWDGMDAVTPTARNILDADTRFQKVVRVAIRVIRRIIGMLLDRHENVHVIMAEGNHDPASSIWLREWLATVYENEPRVSVDTSASPYYCYEHGKTALFYHHGHKKRIAGIDTVFASYFREVFGRTEFAYGHMGHMHSIDVKETNLMVVEQHRTLAAPDAYSARGGWISGRDAKVITYHKEFGEVSRIVISPEMV